MSLANALDFNGNTLTKSNSSGTTQYAWDFENRLSNVTLPSGTGLVTFKYDTFGRRVQKSTPAGATVYLYDGVNAVEELSGSGTLLARYGQMEDVDEPLSVQRSDATAFFHADGLGSITSLTNAGCPAFALSYFLTGP